MDQLFITVVNMSITASFVILIVLVMRWCMRRAGAPKWILCALWAVVFFRLLCPVSFLSEYSLLQMLPQADVIPAQTGTQMQYVEHFTVEQLPLRSSAAEQSSDAAPVPAEEIMVPTAPVRDNTTLRMNVLSGLPFFWLLGVLLFAAYGAYRLLCLYRRVSTATLAGKNVYESDRITGPFVTGIFEPQIYLPLNLSDEARQYILQHEYGHFYRGDLWYKRIAYVALLLHWFNPLVHLAYYLLEQDMEQACDEKVLSQLGSEHKAAYSSTLLNMAIGRQHLLLPLAFGESRTKQRIRNILQYRKLPREALGVFVLLVLMIGMVCVSNPLEFDEWGNPIKQEESYKSEILPPSANESNSVMQKTYWQDEKVQITQVYHILFPDNPLQLQGYITISDRPDDSSPKCYFTFGDIDTERYQTAKTQLEAYMLTMALLCDLENCTVTTHEALDGENGWRIVNEELSEKFLHYAEKLSTYPKEQAGLQQLLTDLHIPQAKEKAALLWPLGEQMTENRQRMEKVQRHFSWYDVYSDTFATNDIWLEQTGKYYLYYYLDKDDLWQQRKGREVEDYQKLSLLMFSLYPDLEELGFRFYGRLHESWSGTSDVLHYTRADLERQFGPLQLDETEPMAAQLADLAYLMRRADSLGVPQVTAQPQLPFYEKLRRIELVQDAAPGTDGRYTQVRFSLLPEQKPLDDGCYLQMDVTTKTDEAGKPQVLHSSSVLWIYGQKAKWQENYSPVLTQKEAAPEYCELLCSGRYEIVVSRWDDELRSALEDLGGKAEFNRSSPWTVVYRGTLTFEQQLPENSF